MLRQYRKQIAQLRKLAEEDDLVPFIGAGMSCPLGLPGWSAFVRQCAVPAGVEAEIEQLLQDDQYPQAAELLNTRLGPGVLQQMIQNTYGNDQIRGIIAKEPLTLVPYLCADPVKGVIATTNFDNSLEAVYDAVGRPLRNRHVGAAMHYGTVALIYDQRHLLKLHGTNEREPDRVLTEGEFRATYGGLTVEEVNIERSLPFLMVEMFASKRALFIGCSLTSDLTMELLRSIFQKTRTVKHFALMEAGKPNEAVLADRLSQAGIRPIWYPHGEHSAAIAAILRAILPGQRPSPAAGRFFEVCGLLALSVSLIAMIGFQSHIGHDPGPRYLVIGMPAIAILEIVLLRIATRFARSTPSQRVTQRMMPGFGAPMRGNWANLRWSVWLCYVAFPLYVCGHFIHMQTHLNIVQLATPEYGYHERAVLGWEQFFSWSSVDFRMLFSGPHYRWAVDGGAQAYPFFQPWGQTILAAVAIILGISYTVRCVTAWGCNRLVNEAKLEPRAYPDGQIDLPEEVMH